MARSRRTGSTFDRACSARTISFPCPFMVHEGLLNRNSIQSSKLTGAKSRAKDLEIRERHLRLDHGPSLQRSRVISLSLTGENPDQKLTDYKPLPLLFFRLARRFISYIPSTGYPTYSCKTYTMVKHDPPTHTEAVDLSESTPVPVVDGANAPNVDYTTLTRKELFFSFALVTSLFFVWGLSYGLIDVLNVGPT